MLTAPGDPAYRENRALPSTATILSGQMGEAIPGECGSASRRFLRFSRLSQVHASRKLTPPSRTSILTVAARAFGWAVSPTSVWRVLGEAGLLSKWNGKPSKKGTGFDQPLVAHQHWHLRFSRLSQIDGSRKLTAAA